MPRRRYRVSPGRVGDQVRITARVVNTESGRIATVVKVDGAVSEIFELQDQIVAELGNGFRSLVDRRTVVAERTPPDATSIASPRGNGNGNGGGNRAPSAGRFAAGAVPVTTPGRY